MINRGQGELPEDYFDLADLYCSGLIDDEAFYRLETILLESEEARRHFVEYFHHHTEIQFTIRAGRAADAVVDRLSLQPERLIKPNRPGRRWLFGHHFGWWMGIAAGALVLAAGLAMVRVSGRVGLSRGGAAGSIHSSPGNIAWLVNAQDCRWAGNDQKPGRDMHAGKALRLERGLAEIEFEQGARVILQGPAGIDLISASSARLRHGTLTARVPAAARGFTVLSPGGKVVDLGTEFGLSVDDGGTSSTVRVFKGEVEAFPLVVGPAPRHGVTVHQDQTAQIDGRTVVLESASVGKDDLKYVRAIMPPPVLTPHTLHLDFTRDVPGTLLDGQGRGIGLNRRLPGTGKGLAERDSNLQLRRDRGALELTTTRSDLNTQEGLSTGEYLGLRLGFTGKEDFEISATIRDIPGLKEVGQFGLYAGSRSDTNIRGGLISRPGLGGSAMPGSFQLFLVNNEKGIDRDIYEVGLMTTGDDLRLTLRRLRGRFSMVVDNLTRNSSSTLEIAHPAFLDHETDLHAGLFGANTQSDVRETLTIREVKVTVWTTQVDNPTIVQAAPRTCSVCWFEFETSRRAARAPWSCPDFGLLPCNPEILSDATKAHALSVCWTGSSDRGTRSRPAPWRHCGLCSTYQDSFPG
jgi:hypothetical protein